MPYKILGSFPVGASQIFGKADQGYARGLTIINNPFMCCGVTSMHSFGQMMMTTFAEKADFLAGLWAVSRGKTHFMYILTAIQASQSGYEHAALLEVGSVKVCEFKSLQHHPWNLLQVFVCDLNAGIGKFFDTNGVPFKAPPTVAAPAVSATVVVTAPSVKKGNTF